MASSLAAITTGGGGLVSTADSTGNLDLKSGTTTIVALTSTGASVTGDLSATGITTVAAGTAALPAVVSATGTADTGLWFPAADTVAASTGGTERLRIDASGNVLVGLSADHALTSARLTVQTAGSAGIISATSSNVNLFCINNSAASWEAISFRYNTSTEVGKIACTSTATTYTTTSDYRLKDAITPMAGALAKVALLKPVTYKWKRDGSDGQGFIAHELQSIVPDCVTGEKDGVGTYTDEDGNEQTRPKYQGIDTSFLVATLTAAIQELKAIIDTQAAQIAALNAKVGI